MRFLGRKWQKKNGGRYKGNRISGLAFRTSMKVLVEEQLRCRLVNRLLVA